MIFDYMADALDDPVVATTSLSGGDVANAYRVALASGRLLFAKTKSDAAPGFFVTESIGLQWLREAGAVVVPEVILVSDDPPLLALEWVEAGRPSATTETEFGRSLAALHDAGAPAFGRQDRRSTGSRGLPNEPCGSWAEFFATQRLLPLARLCTDAGVLPPSGIQGLGSIAARLHDLAGPVEPPARLHGDLWGGNRLIGSGGVSWLIDPAVFGGHREFDLAMMRLFGGFGEDCFAAYAEASPLASGWADRVALHQLAPLAVHALKFGGGYVGATMEAIDRYL